jgi:hypothetical protein
MKTYLLLWLHVIDTEVSHFYPLKRWLALQLKITPEKEMSKIHLTP